MNNRYPLQGMANEVESYGRYGDSELVHLNPIEVAGLASLSPTGQLTTNPVTGKKEAFLPLLIPLLASTGGSALAGAAGAGAIGSAIAGGLASGVATGAITGDWERGLASGVMGAGIGGALGAAGSAAGEAAAAGGTEALASGMTDMSSDLLTAGTQEGVKAAAGAATEAEMAAALAQETALAKTAATGGDMATQLGTAGLPENAAMYAQPVQGAGYGSGFDPSKVSGSSIGQALKQPWQTPKGQGVMSEITKPQSMIPIAYGANAILEGESADSAENRAKKQKEEDDAQRAASYDRIQAAYRLGNPNAPTGLSPYRNQMNPNIPGPWHPGMARGGQVQGYAGGGKMNLRPDDPYGTNGPGSNVGSRNTMGRYGGIDPVSIQMGLSGGQSTRPPDSFRPGIDPEFDYFQADPDNPVMAPPTSAAAMAYRPLERMQQPELPYFQSLTGGVDGKEGAAELPQFAEMAGLVPKGVGMTTTQPVEQPAMSGGGQVGSGEPGRGRYSYGYAAGGDIPLTDPSGAPIGNVAAGGIADIQNQYTAPQAPVPPPAPMAEPQADNPVPPPAMPQAGGQPSDQDIQMLALAVLGKIGDDANRVVEDFISRFGTEMFLEARDFILKQMAPNAQTEGMIQGQGGGMDDMVPGVIGDQQPVAVSPGEYIVPADVVSGLGDGSSDAGAAELDRMAGDVRMARGGSTTQPPPFDARTVMPR